MEDRVLTLHPQGKRGVSMDRGKYEVVRNAILDCLAQGEMTATEIFRCSEDLLEGFEGSVGWHAEMV